MPGSGPYKTTKGDPLREMSPWGVRRPGTGRPSTTQAGHAAQPGNPGPWQPQGIRPGLPVIGIVPFPWTRILYKDGDPRETPIPLVEPFLGTTSGAGKWPVENHQGGTSYGK